ncbi:hypothetical protein GXW71_18650 [Roseomonas hellenica]|uniref:DNA ligase (ATP) n=1 Tax=Plastoroseomonas hellenica TaxID=2687306 RepID=A0ABS5F1G3_9PROT|nr:non-homologous end-joining DNA ligase [Plastoroseomonas hellenica]MBR0666387.1 hypothetical protein [Plastoroseomonas hellenica]
MARAPGKPRTTLKRVARRMADPAPRRIGLSKQLGAEPAPMPGFIEPALASLVADAPKGERWVHEIKFDGYRVQACIRDGSVRLLTRGGLDWTEKFGDQLSHALTGLPVEQAIIDGELVAENELGASDFSALQNALKAGNTGRLLYYAFDLLYLDGHDLRQLPLSRRRDLLGDLLLEPADPVRFSEHFEASGDVVKRHACQLKFEGIISKSLDDPYRSGRAGIWLKVKCSSRQEFVVAGYVPSTASGTAIGSLVLGAFMGERLQHVGRVGTGFTQATARDLYERLEARRAATSPFAGRLTVAARKGVRFVRPELVAEIEFRGWSSDGLLRHASFRGLREDKPAGEVAIEVPKRGPEQPEVTGRG